MCHVSGVMYIFFGQSGGASWWRVFYQRGLPRLVFFMFSIVFPGARWWVGFVSLISLCMFLIVCLKLWSLVRNCLLFADNQNPPLFSAKFLTSTYLPLPVVYNKGSIISLGPFTTSTRLPLGSQYCQPSVKGSALWGKEGSNGWSFCIHKNINVLISSSFSKPYPDYYIFLCPLLLLPSCYTPCHSHQAK